MSSTYGELLKLSIFGQSHGPAIGMTLDGIPAGLPVDLSELAAFLKRRAPGRTPWSTPRKEADAPEFLSGLHNGFTCGAPLAAIIPNTNTKSQDYAGLSDCPRPGHADFTAQAKYGGFQDGAGGGHFSGRLTAPLCIAGGLCIQWMRREGVEIGAHIASISEVNDRLFDPVSPELSQISPDFPVLDSRAGQAMQDAVEQARQGQNSVGGVIECAVTGLPAGIGSPMFGGMEGRIAQILYGIPAVKGVQFGEGFRAARLTGLENNDAFTLENGQIRTVTNHSGGILGGITNGMPLILQAAFKPTPSVGRPQQSVSLSRMEPETLTVAGRHDPCIVPRAVPVVEAAVAIAVYDAFLVWKAGI